MTLNLNPQSLCLNCFFLHIYCIGTSINVDNRYLLHDFPSLEQVVWISSHLTGLVFVLHSDASLSISRIEATEHQRLLAVWSHVIFRYMRHFTVNECWQEDLVFVNKNMGSHNWVEDTSVFYNNQTPFFLQNSPIEGLMTRKIITQGYRSLSLCVIPHHHILCWRKLLGYFAKLTVAFWLCGNSEVI